MRKLLAVTAIVIILLSSCASVPEAGNLSLQDRQRILEVAQKYIGIPYRWGGQDFWWEENPGVDCSGYVINVYKEAIAPSGLALPFDDSTVAVIYSTFSEATGTPLPGDLIFFSDGESDVPSHIGIVAYFEDGKVWFYDASSRPDTGCVLLRSYPVTEEKILGYGKMTVVKNFSKAFLLS